MRGPDCRGQEDCRQESLVILRCKYVLLDWKKEHVPRGDGVARFARSSLGAGGCILCARSIASSMTGTASLFLRFFMLGASGLLPSPDLQTHYLGAGFGSQEAVKVRGNRAHAPQRSPSGLRVCNNRAGGSGRGLCCGPRRWRWPRPLARPRLPAPLIGLRPRKGGASPGGPGVGLRRGADWSGWD